MTHGEFIVAKILDRHVFLQGSIQNQDVRSIDLFQQAVSSPCQTGQPS